VNTGKCVKRILNYNRNVRECRKTSEEMDR